MRIEADSILQFARPETFRAYRDDISDFVSYLPNVRSIEVREREEEGAVVTLTNEWRAGGEIPKAIVSVLSEDALAWTDHAKWDEESWTCHWHIESHSFPDAVRCSGTNRFVELEGGRTRVEILGDLKIEFRRQGLSSVLTEPLVRKIEKFMVRQITTNLTSVSGGLSRYLEDRNGS